ncbi:TAXI family TRAP transporter solute-binding subunit [Roseibium denhamense]|uniref:TAXI family TRAP transporter solute-binding subunit n=2 Tax=Roseibium denhamense TaxID=76305 RepID=A0ABY1PG13_9HYPH|nr:TAXI family TRAP transporter solute-binding subunit [Roseibium denhamense]SMP32093.1 hypothetical protein SAMN06265374_3474 [Roseibium denhamense]
MILHRIAAIVTVLTSCVASVGAAMADDQAFITIGTGGVTGVYYPAGGATCKIVNLTRAEHGVRCSVETSLGSISNLDKLSEGGLDFGYVQSDWQHHAVNGTSIFEGSGPFPKLRSVFSLHTETATIVVPKDSDFFELSDLKGAEISVGQDGSGSAATWDALISEFGWSEADLANIARLDMSELSEALCSGRIEAYFVMVGHPASIVEDTLAQCDIRILGIDGPAADVLLDERPYYHASTIDRFYEGQGAPVPSFGVLATFVTSEDMPDRIVATLVRSILENFEGFKRLHPALGQLDMVEMVNRPGAAPLHNGALNYYRERGLLPGAAE